MKFWDSSALIPLLVREKFSAPLRPLARDRMAIWWGTSVECVSALCRLRREGAFSDGQTAEILADLGRITAGAVEVLPVDSVRLRAEGLLRAYALRAADALQLAAALALFDNRPAGCDFVSLDARLRDTAALEGFRILPERAV